MNSFAVLLLCIQSFLVQNVYGQCLGALAPVAIGPAAALAQATPFGYRTGIPEVAYPGAGWADPYTAGAPYGGAGEGNVAAMGELPVAGTTAVTGQVPIMGAVSFGGIIPAAGAVSISGNCACGCGAGLPYMY